MTLLNQNQQKLLEKVDKLVDGHRTEKAKTKRISDSLCEFRDETRSSNEGFKDIMAEIKEMLAQRPIEEPPAKKSFHPKLSPKKRAMQRMKSKDEVVMKQVHSLKRYQE
mmetsp:Transcript_26639/g.40646  ORF Transcript_26639/g.40646 Transcript_26639/m.40646 type:complete len:109 (+) Transcript_26639:722-1048(+)